MARDLYQDVVKTALIADGWTITDDPYLLRTAFIDNSIPMGRSCELSLLIKFTGDTGNRKFRKCPA